ncbi:TonB-dependent receptor [Pedobacter nototheniae]|uniref:TonB-dependent receptor n=1 Tax=Pedobacter nototheniae TaxID=2488994 RepID=UPI0013F3B1C4|nr:TonB-dependent receptor plug domain-containing protein [Pedobacter nototheniae]
MIDHLSNKPISEVTISLNKNNFQTDENGYFKILLRKGEQIVAFSHAAYIKQTVILNVADQDISKDFFLVPFERDLAQVDVKSKKKNEALNGYLNNYQAVKKSDVEKLPGFLGNPDLLNAIKTLPGFANGGEGNSGLYIRGGSSGQNLLLFNNSTIYNPSHLLGFYSIFNTSAVKEAKVFKSGIPAEYTGRLSSVIDVSSNDSIIDTLSGEASISFLDANASIAIPLTKNWSVSSSARKTFMNYSVWPIVNHLNNKKRSSINNLTYDLYDFNLSTSLKISKQNKLFATAYIGGDQFGFTLNRFDISNQISWQNKAASVNWQSILWNKGVLNTIISYTGYEFNFNLVQQSSNACIKSSILDYNANSTLRVYLDKHLIKLGLNYVRHRFKPNTPDVTTGDIKLDFGKENIYHADESSVFFSDDVKIFNRLSAYAGVRLTYYRHIKPTDFNNDINQTNENFYNKFFIEPTLSLKYKIDDETAIKFSFSRNIQTVHLLPVTASNFPTDFWMPATNEIPPEKGVQFSLGYFKTWGKGFEAYVDLYHKRMSNLIEFNGGMTNFLDNLKIENNVFSGTGKVFGAEFFFKKSFGKLQGALGYTISKNRRTFDLLNNGQPFPFKYDRTHEINIAPNYTINNKWTISALFTYSTGNAYTLPVSRYLISGSIINEYGPFNGARMPVYHRLDIATNYVINNKRNFKSELSLSIYNVYNRKNPIYNYFQFNGDLNKSISIEKKSINLLPILPALSYKITFKR